MNNEHWYVLLTIRSKEEEVCKYLNENDGIYAFSLKMEFYHRVSKQIQQRALFGGYVFVVSKLSQVEVDAIFKKFPLQSVFIHELKYEEEVSALTDEEIRILNMLLDLLPDLSKIVYLDADIFVNTDIKELWEFDISDYCLAAVADEGVIKFHIPNILYKYPEINRNQYFNAGVLCMNLKKIKQRGNLKDMVVEFLVNNPEATYPDQDALNVLFHNTILYLDSSWNQFVYSHREENIDTLKQGIYHFAAAVLVLYSNSKIDMEYFKTLCRTPWSDYEIENRIDGCIGRLNDRINQYEKMIYRLSMPGVKHIFYGEENATLRKLYELINITEEDYRV